MNSDEKTAIRQGVIEILSVIEEWLGQADLIILDEAMAALSCGILKLEEVLHIIDHRGGSEIVLTGRDVPKAIKDKADLITEMRDVKHYWTAGVSARRGIEY